MCVCVCWDGKWKTIIIDREKVWPGAAQCSGVVARARRRHHASLDAEKAFVGGFFFAPYQVDTKWLWSDLPSDRNVFCQGNYFTI